MRCADGLLGDGFLDGVRGDAAGSQSQADVGAGFDRVGLHEEGN